MSLISARRRRRQGAAYWPPGSSKAWLLTAGARRVRPRDGCAACSSAAESHVDSARRARAAEQADSRHRASLRPARPVPGAHRHPRSSTCQTISPPAHTRPCWLSAGEGCSIARKTRAYARARRLERHVLRSVPLLYRQATVVNPLGNPSEWSGLNAVSRYRCSAPLSLEQLRAAWTAGRCTSL
jgi:hypothetical protein